MNEGDKVILDPAWTAAQTAVGEARGEGIVGMHAVLNVIWNRVQNPCWWGNDVISVCLAENQFDCWNENDPNREHIEKLTVNDHDFSLALPLAQRMLLNQLSDITGNADSYYATSIKAPKWVIKAHFTKQIGHQRFYITRHH